MNRLIDRKLSILRDKRTCLYCLMYLNKTKKIPIVNDYFSEETNYNSCYDELYSILNKYYHNGQENIEIINDLEKKCVENLLPINSFSWIFESERATFWVWGYIMKYINPHTNSNKKMIVMSSYYEEMRLNSNPSNHSHRVDMILGFFDSFSDSFFQLDKKSLLSDLKNDWVAIFNKPEPLRWLPDSEFYISWAWDALKNNQRNCTVCAERYSATRINSKLTLFFNPINNSEKRLALTAAIDLWDDAPDTKKLFLLNLNKAWNQKKLRESRTDKKALNTYLKNKTKERLDALAGNNNMRISDMLEKIINEYYNNHN